MGFVILVVLLLYLLVSFLLVLLAVRFARRNGRSVWRWGGLTVLAMYLIPFWDWIPTVAMHRYYCEKEAGFWVYKTLEQWKTENPGVLATLVSNRIPSTTRLGGMNNFTDTNHLNQRFNWVMKKSGPFPMHRWRWEETVVDTKTNEILARYVGFSTGNGWIGGEADLPKIWLHEDYCPNGGISVSRFAHLVESIIRSSGGVK